MIGDKLGLYKAMAQAGPSPRKSLPNVPVRMNVMFANGSRLRQREVM